MGSKNKVGSLNSILSSFQLLSLEVQDKERGNACIANDKQVTIKICVAGAVHPT